MYYAPPPARPGPSTATVLAAVFLGFSILAVLACAALRYLGPAPGPVAPAAPSLAYQLATINAGGAGAPDDATVARFGYLLDNLSRLTPQTRQQIADLSVNGRQILRDTYGRDVSLLAFMEAANRAASAAPGQGYDQITAALIALMGP